MMRQKGFTLVELVVVILILGILAGVAAPKMFNTSAKATDNGLKQTLAIIRDAIEMYSAKNGGTLPPCNAGGSTLHTALAEFIRGPFPKCPVGNIQASTVGPTTGATTVGASPAVTGWVYNTDNGTIVCGFAGASATDASVTYDKF